MGVSNCQNCKRSPGTKTGTLPGAQRVHFTKPGTFTTKKRCHFIALAFCTEKLSAKAILWKQKEVPMEAKRRSNLRINYGITGDQYDQMLEQRGRLCPICGDPNDAPHVDHCHKTGKVRGLLCRRCNLALGMLKDNPKACLRAAIYLQSSLEPGFPCTLNTLNALVAEAFAALGPRKRRQLRRRFA